MKIVLIGGHLTPALSVLDALPKDWQVYFIGRKYALEQDTTLSLEYRLLKESGIDFYPLNSGKLQRVFNIKTLISLSKLPYGIFQSFDYLKQIKPDVVLSFGGYLSIPVCISAYFLGIPVVIHEQTFGAGLANQIVSKFAKKICISWESSRAFFPASKIALTGNPVRKFSKEFKDFPAGGQPLIYVTGGSSGSHAINSIIESSLDKLLEHFRLIHQTGDALGFGDYDRLKKHSESLVEKLKKRYVLRKFVNPSEVGSILQASKLVVSRSGINTVTEILHYDKPCVLIPLSLGQSGEQMKNAIFLQKLGLAKIIDQEKATTELLLKTIDSIIESTIFNKQRKNVKYKLINDAAERIVKEVYDVTKKI